MGLGGELATLYVRLRPNLAGFGAEATAGVKRSMAGVTEEVNATAKANVAATQSQLAELRNLEVGYKEVAASAVKGSDEQILASKAAADAQIEANRLVGRSAVAAGAETSKIKGHLLGLGSALGLAFGADIAIKGIKDLANDAAGVQKSAEVIKNEFGASGEAVAAFGEKGAHALNITTKAADATSARFGILFQNIGIGQDKAAQMTIGFEKLVGSMAEIRGIDPTPLLNSIALAAAGNTRGLKQLGIVVDGTTIKYAAYAHGLTQSLTQAITPAIKAQAIYQIAIQHLPQFLDQAEARGRPGQPAAPPLGRVGDRQGDARPRPAPDLQQVRRRAERLADQDEQLGPAPKGFQLRSCTTPAPRSRSSRASSRRSSACSRLSATPSAAPSTRWRSWPRSSSAASWSARSTPPPNRSCCSRLPREKLALLAGL